MRKILPGGKGTYDTCGLFRGTASEICDFMIKKVANFNCEIERSYTSVNRHKGRQRDVYFCFINFT